MGESVIDRLERLTGTKWRVVDWGYRTIGGLGVYRLDELSRQGGYLWSPNLIPDTMPQEPWVAWCGDIYACASDPEQAFRALCGNADTLTGLKELADTAQAVLDMATRCALPQEVSNG